MNRAPRFLILPTIILIGILTSTAAMLRQLSCRRLQQCLSSIKIGYHRLLWTNDGICFRLLEDSLANIVVGMQDALVYSFTEPEHVSFQILLKNKRCYELVLYRSECRCITSYDIASYN